MHKGSCLRSSSSALAVELNIQEFEYEMQSLIKMRRFCGELIKRLRLKREVEIEVEAEEEHRYHRHFESFE
jgi:hypothetical protein